MPLHGARPESCRLGSSSFAGDAIRTVKFRETLKGYRRNAVDGLLIWAAAEVDAGRDPTDALMHAKFPETWKGYHRDGVDDFIRHLAASPSTFQNGSSTTPFGGAQISFSGSQSRPNPNAVWIGKSTKDPSGRHLAKGWTRLKVTLSAIFLLVGVLAAIAGAATWHSVSSRPHVVASVTRQFHCVTDADTGTACDERVVFQVGGREIHTVVRSADPRRDLYGPPGHQSITIFYDPTAPSHVEGVNGVALDGVAVMLGGVAAIIGVIVIGLLITRDGRRLRSGKAPLSEIHRSLAS